MKKLLHARTSDPATSHQSAALANQQTEKTADVILDALNMCPNNGLTTHEIASVTGRHVISISPMMRPMSLKGQVHDSGRRRINVASGHKAIVWKIGAAPSGTGDTLRKYESKNDLRAKILILEQKIKNMTNDNCWLCNKLGNH